MTFLAGLVSLVVAALVWAPVLLPHAEDAAARPADAEAEDAGMLPARALAGEFYVLDGTVSAGR